MADDGRRMIYPITIAQQLKHFPFKFHWKHCSRFSYYFISLGLCIPVFYYMEKLSYAPSNVKKYEEYLQREKKEHEQHMHHLEGYYEDRHGH